MKTTTEIIAREGWKVIGIGIVALILCWFFSWECLGFLATLVVLSLLYFYYNPERIPQDTASDVIIAPLDAKITQIESQEEWLYLELKKPPCFCGLLRMPFEGNVKRFENIKGLLGGNDKIAQKITLKFEKDLHKESLKNPQIKMELYPSSSSYSLYFEDSSFKIASRIGFFLQGRVKMYLPKKTELKASVGDIIRGGSDILGYLR